MVNEVKNIYQPDNSRADIVYFQFSNFKTQKAE